MSDSILGRVLRPVTLLLAGMLLGQVTLSVATPTTAATTRTRVASCSGLNFHPIHYQTTWRWDGHVLMRVTDAGDGWFLCDPNLPNKAVVTRVRFTLQDDDRDINIRFCGLMRASLTSGSTSSQALATVSETGLTARPGTVRRTDGSISRATIDQSRYSYWLQCQIVFNGGLVRVEERHHGIIGADVTYKISSTNG